MPITGNLFRGGLSLQDAVEKQMREASLGDYREMSKELLEDSTGYRKQDLKYNEEAYLKEALEYVRGTYGAHYAGQDGVQAFDLIVSSGNAQGFCLGSILKYAARWGKKDGYQRKDLLKIMHYVLMLLWVMDQPKGG